MVFNGISQRNLWKTLTFDEQSGFGQPFNYFINMFLLKFRENTCPCFFVAEKSLRTENRLVNRGFIRRAL